ncbi:hypothetical protein CB1_000505007 [Camelus ferus]|nr:hypothetical protein CB1_000505007 [Camelus ferus]
MFCFLGLLLTKQQRCTGIGFLLGSREEDSDDSEVSPSYAKLIEENNRKLKQGPSSQTMACCCFYCRDSDTTYKCKMLKGIQVISFWTNFEPAGLMGGKLTLWQMLSNIWRKNRAYEHPRSDEVGMKEKHQIYHSLPSILCWYMRPFGLWYPVHLLPCPRSCSDPSSELTGELTFEMHNDTASIEALSSNGTYFASETIWKSVTSSNAKWLEMNE